MSGNDTQIKLDANTIDGRIPLKEKFAFGAGDIFGSGWAALMAVTLFFFFNNVVGLDARLAGLIVMLARITDAITDTLMGVITDNTRTRWGRRRPYLFLGALLIIPALAFLFVDHSWLGIEKEGAKFAVSLVAFMLFSSLNSVSQVPYVGLVSDISPNQKERTNANLIKTLFNMVAAAICFLVPTMLLESYDSGTMDYTTFYLILVFGFGSFFAIPLIFTSIFCKERAPYLDVKVKLKEVVKEYAKPFKVKSFVLYLGMYVAAFFCMDVISALAVYYAGDVLRLVANPFASLPVVGGESMSTIFIVAPLMIFAGAMFPVVMWLMKKYGKAAAYRTGIPLYIIGGIGLAIFNPSWTNMGWLIPIFAIIMGIGFSGAQIMPWIIFPDTVDVAELKLGTRPSGAFGSVTTFMRKMANALAILMVSQILGAAGQIPGTTKELVDDRIAAGLEPIYQPASVLTAISLTMGITIVAVMGIAFFVSLRYKVTAPKLERARYFIDKARNSEELTPEEAEEKALLTKELC
jgi:GPH family glycoside/pentoside/hexuronide:cation symporter/oligogalacturonide transporter